MMSSVISVEAHPVQTGYSTSRFYGGSNRIPVRNFDVTDNKTGDTAIQLKPSYTMMSEKNDREDERLKTFSSWPLPWLASDKLALTGMFYTGDSDKVKCYFCGVEIGCWERTDDPISEHIRWSPNCPLLRRRTTNNVPLNAEALERVLPPFSYDVCGFSESIEVRPNSFAEATIGDANESIEGYTDTATGVARMPNSQLNLPPSNVSQRNYFPEYPEYAVEAARLRSFTEWPSTMKLRPEKLAEAGFFFRGIPDRVKCFSCGGGLKDWDENDDPWEQHAQWLSNCRFLKLMKDQKFIDDAIAKLKTQLKTQKAATDECALTAAPGVMKSDIRAAAEAIVAKSDADNCKKVAPTSASLTQTVCLGDDLKIHGSTAEEAKLCKICYAGEYNTAFLPCGHVVACAKCASSVTKCPMCRKPFTDVMRVYFS